jgi:4-carboxymuconolactone decarboxylase
MPRVAPLPEAQWPEGLRTVLGRRQPPVGARLGENNIFSTLARHEALFRAWLPFGGFLLRAGVLPARERELLILRTAWNCASPYEWGQHVRICEQLGMSREEIDRAADELHESARICEQTWRALNAEHDEQALIEITMLVGHYHMVAYALNSLEVELDDGLEGLPGRDRSSSSEGAASPS